MATGPAPAATPAPGAQPGYVAPTGNGAQPAAQNMALTTPEPPPEEKPQPEVKTFSFVPRLGFMVTGSGTMERKCTGADCDVVYDASRFPPFDSGSDDFDHKPGVAIGADFMFKLGDLFRIGPGILHTFNMSVEPSGFNESTEIGSLTDFDFVAEVIPRVGRSVWLIPRVQFGLSMFVPAGEFNTSLKSMKDYCSDNSEVFKGCGSLEGPYVGYNVGLGFGAMFAVAPTVRLRVDSLYQYYSINGYEVSVNVEGADAKGTATLSGSRSLLMGGVEF